MLQETENILYYVYVDYTDDNIPYYVGKGCKRRSVLKERNGQHDWRMRHLGLERVIVYETYDEDSSFSTEIFLIADLHTFIHDSLCTIGCNYTQGGEGPSGLKHSEESINLIKYKRSLQLPVKPTPVLEYDLLGKFTKKYDTLKEATLAKNANICGVLQIFKTKGIIRIAGGSMWRKYDPNVEIPQQIEPYTKYVPKVKKHAVIKLDLNGVEIQRYDSMSQASKENNVSVACIASYCYGKANPKTAKRFLWKFVDDECFKLKDGYVRGKPRRAGKFNKETGELITSYKSVSEAFKLTNISSISHKCQGLVDTGEFIWKFI